MATSVEAALQPQGPSKQDLVIPEPRLGGAPGMEVLTRLRTARPEVPIIVRSTNFTRTSICAALQAGILGYFPKAMPSRLFVAGLQYIAVGGVFVPAEVWGEALVEHEYSNSSLHALTPGQTRVLRVLLTGRSNREIGKELNISEGTVKQHLYALYRTLGVSTRASIIAGAGRGALQHYEMPAGSLRDQP